jgi:hypothetical protein
MSLELNGSVTITRRLADHWLWQREPLCALACWVDLLILARQDFGEISVNGHPVQLQRGDVGFAMHTLALRWRRSREWVTKFLHDCVERRMVELISVEKNAPRRGTIIRIVNYDTYNPPTVPVSIRPTNPPTVPAQSKEVGKGIQEERKGEARNFPTIEEAVLYFRKNGADYTEPEIESAWHEFTAGMIDGQWMTGRPPRPVADWRSALGSELWKRRQIFGSQKNPARGAERVFGEPPPSAVSGKISIAEMRV